MSWRELSDDELRARLIQRGIPTFNAEAVVADRDRLEDVLEQILGDE